MTMGADGNWQLTVHTPKGDMTWHLAIETAGETFTGKMTMTTGSTAIENGTIDGDQLTWESSLVQPASVKVNGEARLSGDRISGEIKMGMYGTRSFSGTRA
uniref:PyrI2 n=1 Tax=Streptomyces rugosporus TaxID=295838 RepID=K7QRJ9_STRRG|nr:PyrI2 [Streptomyces rugosporus]